MRVEWNVFELFVSQEQYDEFENEIDQVKEYQNKFNIDDKGMINCIWKIYIEIKHRVTNEQQLDSYIKDYCGL